MGKQPWLRGHRIWRGRRVWQSLLARVTLTYAIGALLLSSIMAGASFVLAQNQLLADREGQHLEQVIFNAKDIRERLEALTPETAAEEVGTFYENAFKGLPHPNGSQSIVLLPDGDTKSLSLTRPDIPAPIVGKIRAGTQVAEQRYEKADRSISYMVGVRLDDVPFYDGDGIIYYETVSLAELESTLGSLRVILAGVAVISSLAGAMLGYYSARRALAPVGRISGAAMAIAGGDLTTKLDLQADRDLSILSDAFNNMVDAVATRIEREERFTSDVSHELRSPLMTLAASVEVLERRKESLPDVAQQAVDLLSQDLHRFQRLVEDLLEVSRLEAGAVKLQLSRFKLAEFLENVIAQTKSAYVEISFSGRDANSSITADKRRLAQVMTNLIENAEKYGNGPSGVSFEVIGDKVRIIVEDDGPGVPASQRERIFERFRRMGAGNRASGTGFGLGLSLVAEHARLHGGSVWVTDRTDGRHGAQFVVQLPLGEHVDVVEEMAT